MTKILRSNLQTLCRRNQLSADVQNRWDSLTIKVNSDDEISRRTITHILSHTPGIGFSLAIDEHKFTNLDDAYTHLLAAYREQLSGKTFCVRIKRAGYHDFTSHDAEILFGGYLLRDTDAASVSLKNPDVLVQAEIRNDKLQIISDVIPGLGGFPLGSQGEVLSLISGGFDSTVASYLTIRRGLKTHYCFFNLGGSAHEIGVKQMAHYLWNTYSESHRVKFVSIPFEAVVTEILTHIETSQMGVVLKRMMLRAASEVADRLNLPALVTGEAVAQVASQTITNLAVIDQASNHMVLRPLAAMDKQEIINISRQIGTETLAAAMPEYCGVISKNPTTYGDRRRVIETEAAFNFQVLEDAIDSAVIQKIDHVLEGTDSGLENVEIISTPALTDTIIDIRHPDEVDSGPLDINHNDVLCIPFYELESRLNELEPNQRYLLYCRKGTMSKIHAQHLNTGPKQQFAVYLETITRPPKFWEITTTEKNGDTNQLAAME